LQREVPKLELTQALAILWYYSGRDVFAQRRMGHRKDDDLLHAGVADQDVFDFARRDFLAATVDDFLDTPCQ